jgi:hypothetical protein
MIHPLYLWVINFPPGERVLVGGLDGEGGIASQVHREKGTPPAYLPPALWPSMRDGRHRHAVAAEVPPRREVHVRPRDGLAVLEELASQLDRHVDTVAQGPRSTRRPHRVRGASRIRPLRRRACRRTAELTRRRHLARSRSQSRPRDADPDASPSCAVFRLKGQRLFMVCF